MSQGANDESRTFLVISISRRSDQVSLTASNKAKEKEKKAIITRKFVETNDAFDFEFGIDNDCHFLQKEVRHPRNSANEISENFTELSE